MNNRVGGLKKVNLDPAVASMLKDASINKAALNSQQKKDRQRVRSRIDLPQALKEEIAEQAERAGSSASQLSAFLLAYAVKEFRHGNHELIKALEEGCTPSRNMQVDNNISIPGEWLDYEAK